MKAMDGFHTFADWKAQNIIARLLQCKVDCDQLQAQCDEMTKEVNMGANECAQREVHKNEVCVYIYSLPFYIQT
jgi:cell fate (sporulation/competence/biofilm development) regulator YlbF (YheA/YmcA/DUF963 family)